MIDKIPNNLETLRVMINADLAEFNAEGGGHPVEVVGLFGAIMENFFMQLSPPHRKRLWGAFKRNMDKKMETE